MADRIDVTEEQLVGSLVTNYGIVAKTAKMLKMSVATIYRMIEKFGLKGKIEEIRSNIDDLALESVVNGIDDPKVALGLLNLRSKSNAAKVSILGDKDGFKIIVGTKEDGEDLDKFLEE